MRTWPRTASACVYLGDDRASFGLPERIAVGGAPSSPGRSIPFFGDGSSRRDYTFIDDVVHGVRAAMDYAASRYEIINLGNSATVSLLQLVETLEDVLGTTAKLERLPEQPGDVPQTWADTEKAGRLLGFRPATPIRLGIERFTGWLGAGEMNNLVSTAGST